MVKNRKTIFPSDLTVFRHHLHQCPGHPGFGFLREHPVHVWRCFRPECDDAPEYICGFLAETFWQREENALKGREAQKRIREEKQCQKS